MLIASSARAASALGLFAACCLVVGCGGGKPVGTVTGTVTYKGTPVQTGNINFLSKTGAAGMAKIGESGAFKVDAPLDAGDYTVYVTPPVPEPQPPGTRPAPPKKFEVPARFRAPTSSGLVVTIKSGSNTIPVDLTD